MAKGYAYHEKVKNKVKEKHRKFMKATPEIVVTSTIRKQITSMEKDGERERHWKQERKRKF